MDTSLVEKRIATALTAATMLAAGAALAPDHASARSLTQPRSHLPGVVGFTPNGLHADKAKERLAEYRRLRRAGARAIRLDLTWSRIEQPGPPLHDFDFTEYDREVRIIRRAGLRVIGLLAYGHPDHSRAGAAAAAAGAGGGLPPFGIGAAHLYPPDDPADFARYARATARHFGNEVIGWEIWNEQNEGWRFWPPREDPAAYARLLCAAAKAIRRPDPRTPVIFGGVFYPAVPPGLPGLSGPQFVSAAYAAQPRLGRCFDVLAYHPYPYPFSAPEAPVPGRGSVLDARAGMIGSLPHYDRDKPLWITEVGWPTHSAYGVSEAKQAQYLVRTLAASFAQRIPVLNLYTYGDEDDPTGELNQEAHFGVVRSDGTAKPALRALRAFSRALRQTRFRADLSRRLGLPESAPPMGEGGGFALRFSARANKRSRRVTILWHAAESVREEQGSAPAAAGGIGVRLPLRYRRVRVRDHLGRPLPVRPSRRSLRLNVGPAPVYVVERPRR